LRSLYFLLAGSVHKFVYLKPGLAMVLAVIGTKMLLADVVHLPATVSLGVVGVILAGAIGLSLLANRGHRRSSSVKATPKETGPQGLTLQG
jgi:tellurite resistance protein TerC